MRTVLALVLLLACKDDKPAEQRAVEAKEQAVEAARKAADEAQRAMEVAQDKAKAAWERARAATAEHAQAAEEHAQVKDRLAKLREETAKTIALANDKLVELRRAVADLTKRIAKGGPDAAKLEQEKRELETSIEKIEKMKTELEATNAVATP